MSENISPDVAPQEKASSDIEASSSPLHGDNPDQQSEQMSESGSSIHDSDSIDNGEESSLAPKSSMISTLRLISVILSVLTGIVTLAYTVYGFLREEKINPPVVPVESGSQLIRSENTIILHSSDIRTEETATGNEDAVIQAMMQQYGNKHSGVATNIFVGKVRGVQEHISSPYGQSHLAQDSYSQRNIVLTLEKTYDITKNSPVQEDIVCMLDGINSNYFRKINPKQFDYELSPLGIAIHIDDIVGFRHTVANNGVCEVFQVNMTQLEAFKKEMSTISNVSDVSVFTGKFDWMSAWKPTDVPQGIPDRGMIRNMSGNTRNDSPFSVVYLSVPSPHDHDSLLANIACEVPGVQMNELMQLFQSVNIMSTTPVAGMRDQNAQMSKSRFRLTVRTIGKPERVQIPTTRFAEEMMIPGNAMNRLPLYTLFFSSCSLEKMEILDLSEEHIVETKEFSQL